MNQCFAAYAPEFELRICEQDQNLEDLNSQSWRLTRSPLECLQKRHLGLISDTLGDINERACESDHQSPRLVHALLWLSTRWIPGLEVFGEA